MTVGEIIEKLEKYDRNTKVYDSNFEEIECITEKLWTHTNYPYDKPEEIRLCIE